MSTFLVLCAPEVRFNKEKIFNIYTMFWSTCSIQ